jgi:hypothetical protein
LGFQHSTIVAGNNGGEDIVGPLASSAHNLVGNPVFAGGLTNNVNSNAFGDDAGQILPISTVLNTNLA